MSNDTSYAMSSSWLLVSAILLFIASVDLFFKIRKKDRERLAKLPQEIRTALEKAQKATSDCLEMCSAAAFIEDLKLHLKAHFPSSRLNSTNGPSERILLLKTKAKSLKALKKCRCLSIEGLNLTSNARYLIMCSIFQSAELACRNCEHQAGLDACPALSFLDKMELS